MLTKFLAIALTAGVAVSGAAALDRSKPIEVKLAMTCFSKGEQVSGSNKICYYDCLGSTMAITVPYVDLCPLTAEG